ncbi:hypothetical protein OROGR_008310 [Orobanche gracilis]
MAETFRLFPTFSTHSAASGDFRPFSTILNITNLGSSCPNNILIIGEAWMSINMGFDGSNDLDLQSVVGATDSVIKDDVRGSTLITVLRSWQDKAQEENVD